MWNTTEYRNKPGPAGAPGLPQPLWNGQIQAWDTEAFRLAHDFTVSPNMVNHLSFAKNTFTKNSFSANVDKNWGSKVCIKNVVDCNQNFPTINFTDFTGWGGASYNGTNQPGWGLKDDLSYIRGKHSDFRSRIKMPTASVSRILRGVPISASRAPAFPAILLSRTAVEAPSPPS